MPVNELVDLSNIDLESIKITKDQIYEILPHRHEMALLDGIVHFDREEGLIVGFHQVREDEFWVRGHIPGRPLMPGVLMVESAGQLCGYYFDTVAKDRGDAFFGFAALEDVRFRGTVQPGQKLFLAARVLKMRKRSGHFNTQAYVDGKIVYDGTIRGMIIPSSTDTPG